MEEKEKLAPSFREGQTTETQRSMHDAYYRSVKGGSSMNDHLRERKDVRLEEHQDAH